MAKTKTGTIVSWNAATPGLAVFRLMPEAGSSFPEYKAGQYIALGRRDCRLTRKVVGGDGEAQYPFELDARGEPKRGMVTHAYSIASAPFETEQDSYLEFYIILERYADGSSGRLTESMFRMHPESDNQLTYFDTIKGEFTLERRAAGFDSVILVGTGTGLAPFASMIKQLDYEAGQGRRDGVRYTLLHANRTYAELDYRADLAAIEAEQRFDFTYLPSVSRPTPDDVANAAVGKGRANNVLRYLFGMPTREEQDVDEAHSRGKDTTALQKTLDRTVKPVLPGHIGLQEIQRRVRSPRTVIITCGNPGSMADIQYVAEANEAAFEKEDW